MKQNEAPKFTKITPSFHPIRKEVDGVFEHFAGRTGSEPVYNASGCRVNAEVVLVRTYAADPFKLAIKLGDTWHEVAKVAPDDPAIQELPIIEHGKSPAQIQQEERKAAAERARREAEEAERQRRREIHLERVRLAQEAEQRAREEQRQGM